MMTSYLRSGDDLNWDAIVDYFSEKGHLVTPNAVEFIQKEKDPFGTCTLLGQNIADHDLDMVIKVEDLMRCLSSKKKM